MSFVRRARSSVERGDTLRAVLTLIAGLRRAPGRQDAMALLVELVRDRVDSGGVEHEIAQVLVPHPQRDELLTEMVDGLLARDHEKLGERLRSQAAKRGISYIVPPEPEPAPEPEEVDDPPSEQGEPAEPEEQGPSEQPAEGPDTPEDADGEDDAVAIAEAQKAAEAEMSKRQEVARRERQAAQASRRRRRLAVAIAITSIAGLLIVGFNVLSISQRTSDLTSLDTAIQRFDRFDSGGMSGVERASAGRTEPVFDERVAFARALGGDLTDVRLDGWSTEWGLAAAAISALAGDDLESAIALVTKLERSHPEGLAGRYARALLEERRGDADRARAASQQLLDAYPAFAPAHEVMIRLAARQLDFDVMRASILKLQAIAPDHPYAALGSLPHPREVLLGPVSAEEPTLESTERGDAFLEASDAYRRAVAAGLRGRTEDAVKASEAATKADPRFVPARLVYGAALAASGRADDAAAQFRQAAADARSAEVRTLLQAAAPLALLGAGRPDLAGPFTTPFPKVRGEGVDDRFDDTVAESRPEFLRRSALPEAATIPWAADALFARAELFAATGQYPLARATLVELSARRISPGRAKTMMHWLSLVSATNQPAEVSGEDPLVALMNDWAAGRFSKVVGLPLPADGPAWWRPLAVEFRVSSMLALRQLRPAFAELDKASVGLAYRPRLRGLRLRALARLGRENGAYVGLLDRMSKPDPGTISRLLDLAEAAFWQGQFSDAEGWLAAVAKLDSAHREAAWICALVMRGRSRDEDAERCFERSGRAWGSTNGLIVELGYLQLQFRRPKKAQELFQKALSADRADVDAARGLGEAYNKLPRRVADRDLTRIAASYGGALPTVRGEFQKWLAVVRGVRKGEPEGLAALDAAAALVGERDDIMMERARYHGAREEWDRARELYTGALRRNATLADAHVAIARIDLRSGAKESARTHLERYLELEPRGPSASWCRRKLE